jgi:4-amino-4-deoxy-L-arabinose transferase-like glycosyltransferase
MRPGARPDRLGPSAAAGPPAAAVASGVPAESPLKSVAFLAATALYLVLFLASQPARGQSFFLLLLPDQVISSWVQGNWKHFQLLDRWPLVLVAGAILGLAYLSGRLTLTAVGCERGLSGLEVGTFSLAVGLAQWSLLTLGVGLAGGLHGPWLHLAAVGVLAGGAWGRWQRRRRASPDTRGLPAGAGPDPGSSPGGRARVGVVWSWLERYGCWLGLPFLLLILLGAMLPPWDFDVREYHLQVPKEWFQAGRIVFLPHNVYGNMPLGAELHAVLAMVFMPAELGWWWGALAGKTVIACFAPLAALGLLAAGRRFATPTAGVVAALVYLSSPWVVHVSQAGLIEGAVGCYSLLAVYALAIWAGDASGGRRDQLLLAGFLAGAAAACKYPPLLFVVAPLTLVAMFAHGRIRWQPAALFLAAALCGCGLWYAKNWVQTGNPVYPLLVGGASWTPEQQAQWDRAHRVPPDERGRRYTVEQALTAAADIGWRNLWQSPLLLPLAAAAVLAAWRRPLVWWLAVYVGFYLVVWWLATHRVDRFWVPLLPVLAWLAGRGAVAWTSSIWRRGVMVLLLFGLAANLLFLLSAGVYDHRYLMSLERLRRDEPAEPGGLSRVHAAHRYLNAHAADGDRVLLVGDAQPFDLQLPALYSTCFDGCLFERWLAGRTADQRRAALRERGIRYVLVAWSEIDRYRSPGNYGFSDYVTRSLVREELVRQQQVLRPIPLDVDPEIAELFLVQLTPPQVSHSQP